jgi:hypothetical protein
MPGIRRRQRLWLGRYSKVWPLWVQGTFHVYGCHDEHRGQPCTVVVGSPHAPLERVETGLREAARVHTLLPSEVIAAVLDLSNTDGVEFLSFSCPARGSLAGAFQRRVEMGAPKLTHGQMMALASQLATGLMTAHRVMDPVTGRQVALGALALSAVLVGEDGTLWLTGFGDNLTVERQDGALGWTPGVYQAPEVGAGAPPTPDGDQVAMFLFLRSLLPHTQVPPALARVERGCHNAEDGPLATAFFDLTRRLMGSLPNQRRASLHEVLDMFGSVPCGGTCPDEDGLRSWLADLVSPETPTLDLTPNADGNDNVNELLVDEEVRWYKPPGKARCTLEHRGVLRRILRLLVDHRLSQPGTPLSAAAMMATGWPGERPIAQAGAHRVRVALSTLRQMGLRTVLLRSGAGWMLDPAVAVRRMPAKLEM